MRRLLELADLPVTFSDEMSRDVNRFVYSYLHKDGIFVLRSASLAHCSLLQGQKRESGLGWWRCTLGSSTRRT